MRQVPQRERTGGVGCCVERGHVVQAAAAVVDLREHQHRRVGAQGLGDLPGRVDQLQAAALFAAQRLRDVEVGREVAALADDHPARRRVLALDRERGAEQLEQVDRGRIGHHQLTRTGAQQRGDLVADARRHRHPAGRIPAADQALAPLLADQLLHPRRGSARQQPQRVAVEVDQAAALRQMELVAQRRERIGGVQRQGMFAGHQVFRSQGPQWVRLSDERRLQAFGLEHRLHRRSLEHAA